MIDATGRVVTPGGIESHAHIHEPMYRGWTGGEEVWLQPPEGATRAAAHGGTTTVLSFAFLDVHVTDRAYDTTEAVAQRREIFTGRSYVDFAFHPVITGSASAETLASLATAVDQGTPSFKVFTTDVTTGQAGIRIDHGSVLAAMRIAREAGGIVMVHAEDDDLIKYNEARLKREGRNQLQNIRCAHTPFGEALAFRQVAALAAEAGAATYFVHTTAGESVGVVAAERQRGRPVYAETLHKPVVFLRGGLPEARRCQVPHRHGTAVAAGSGSAVGRGDRRRHRHGRHRRVHDVAGGEARRPRHRDGARRTRGDRDAGHDPAVGGLQEGAAVAAQVR